MMRYFKEGLERPEQSSVTGGILYLAEAEETGQVQNT